LRFLALKRAFFWRFPQVFMSHHLRVRLWLVSKKAARQVGDAHKANPPSRSPAMMLIASALGRQDSRGPTPSAEVIDDLDGRHRECVSARGRCRSGVN
jgi:hypothetical protein